MPLWLIKIVLYPFMSAVVLWAWFRWSHRKLINAASQVPCAVAPLPIIGHLLHLIRGYNGTTEFMIRMWREARAKGLGTVCVWVGPVPIIVVPGADDVKQLLKNNSLVCRGIMTSLSEPFLSHGLLTAPEDHWRTTRKHLDLLFHPSNLNQLFPVFNCNSNLLIDNLAKYVGGARVDLMRLTSVTALQTVCQLIFGLDQNFDTESKEFEELSYVTNCIPELFVSRVMNPLLWNDQVFTFIYKEKLAKIQKKLENFITTPLKEAKEKIQINKRRTNILDYYKTNDKNHLKHGEPLTAVRVYSFLQEALASCITNKHLQDEIVTLLVTGTDTLSCAVSSCLLAIAQYQDIQEKLYSEIVSVMGSNKHITQDHLRRLPYLDQVVKESLRWSTVIPFIVRRTTEPVKLGMCMVPEDTTIFLCIGSVLTDPKTFPDPYKFDPNRFSPNKMTNDRQAFIPFGGGPRNCIGKTYAQMFIKVMIVNVVQTFKLDTDMDINSIERRVSVIMHSTEGYQVTLTKRS